MRFTHIRTAAVAGGLLAGVLAAPLAASAATQPAAQPSPGSCHKATVDLKQKFKKVKDSCQDLNIVQVKIKRHDIRTVKIWGEYWADHAWHRGKRTLTLHNGSYKPPRVLLSNVKPGSWIRVRSDHGALVGVLY